jgi:hypothetical protein
MIYVPGLAESVGSADSFAGRVARAMDEEAPFEAATYSVQPAATTDVAATASSAVRRIIEHRSGATRVVADVYRMEYEQNLRRGFDTANPLKRSILLMVLVLRAGVFQLLPAFRRKGKKAMAKAQLGFALVVALGLSLYTIVILAAALDTSRRILWGDHHLGPFQGVAVVLAGLSALVPATKRKALEYAAVDFYAASNYLASGTQRSNLSSKLSALLEDIVEQVPAGTPVYVVGFSFGSIVALDTILPPSGAQPRRMKRVTALVTIGSPFDLVRSIWPTYFTNRAGEKPSLWANVFDPMDVIGSNFRDSNDAEVSPAADSATTATGAPIGVGLAANTVAVPKNLKWESGSPGDSLTLPRILTFAGLRAHGLYWDWADPNDVGAIRLVVNRLALEFPAFLAQPR